MITRSNIRKRCSSLHSRIKIARSVRLPRRMTFTSTLVKMLQFEQIKLGQKTMNPAPKILGQILPITLQRNKYQLINPGMTIIKEVKMQLLLRENVFWHARVLNSSDCTCTHDIQFTVVIPQNSPSNSRTQLSQI
ncbi:hypothetical protein V6N13_145175 [Hibiscus sabdariffa]|uniref:Uncharacterized protein n=1 Tax=Hibiscus sabdariffa TaxID=183260 RepID=A0ABR1ZK18_9ROSI